MRLLSPTRQGVVCVWWGSLVVKCMSLKPCAALSFVLLFFLFKTPFAYAECVVSEREALGFVESLDRSVKEKHLSAIADLISHDVSIIVTSNVTGQIRKEVFDKTTYLNSLNHGFAATSYYQYKRESIRFTVEQNQALGVGRVTESLVMKGVYVSARTDEMFTLACRSGSLKLIKYEGKQLKK